MRLRQKITAAALALVLLTVSAPSSSAETVAFQSDDDVLVDASFSLAPLHDALLWQSSVFVYESALYHQSVAVEAYEAQLAAQKAAAAKAAAAKQSSSSAAAQYGSGACGGSLPSCSIMHCESKGNIRAQNPRSSASGKWQFIDSTWAGYGGYAHAWQAPEHVQDERARQLWNGGAGRSHWVC